MANWTLSQLPPGIVNQVKHKLAQQRQNVRMVKLLDSVAEVRGAGKGVSKYGNKKVTCDSQTFDSEKEYARYQELLLMQKGGAIRGLKLQVPYVLAPPYLYCGKNIPAIRYLADFVYEEKQRFAWVQVVEDVKGAETPVYRLKRHLMATVHGVTIRET